MAGATSRVTSISLSTSSMSSVESTSTSLSTLRSMGTSTSLTSSSTSLLTSTTPSLSPTSLVSSPSSLSFSSSSLLTSSTPLPSTSTSVPFITNAISTPSVSITPPGLPTHSRTPTTSPYQTSTKVVSGNPKTIVKHTTITTSPKPTHKPGLAPESQDSSSSGLSTAGTIAIAVIVPIVVIALLILLLIFCWRRRKQRKVEQEQRRKEVEEYGYNPNHDATLPAVGGIGSDSPEMSEDATGYRGWGNNTNGGLSARKTSTNMSSGMGMTMSEDGRGVGIASPAAAHLAGDGFAEGTGAAVATGVMRRPSKANGAGKADNLQRGLSNASSFSAGRTDESGDMLGGGHPDYGYENNYSQYAPYQAGGGNQPIIRDVNARRNTKIENAAYPQQGNSGIAQNF